MARKKIKDADLSEWQVTIEPDESWASERQLAQERLAVIEQVMRPKGECQAVTIERPTVESAFAALNALLDQWSEVAAQAVVMGTGYWKEVLSK